MSLGLIHLSAAHILVSTPQPGSALLQLASTHSQSELARSKINSRIPSILLPDPHERLTELEVIDTPHTSCMSLQRSLILGHVSGMAMGGAECNGSEGMRHAYVGMNTLSIGHLDLGSHWIDWID
ncbi:hypothetical protein BGX38DRAFT_1334353 [Terfezia claveryi]|nr:hypothetical protein BGX38DRAFT_1334353 [Terfezia claveryi]